MLQHLVTNFLQALLNDGYSRTEVVTIHGPSGAWKSALVATFIRYLLAHAFCSIEGNSMSSN